MQTAQVMTWFAFDAAVEQAFCLRVMDLMLNALMTAYSGQAVDTFMHLMQSVSITQLCLWWSWVDP